jgi:hypothetical protein
VVSATHPPAVNSVFLTVHSHKERGSSPKYVFHEIAVLLNIDSVTRSLGLELGNRARFLLANMISGSASHVSRDVILLLRLWGYPSCRNFNGLCCNKNDGNYSLPVYKR